MAVILFRRRRCFYSAISRVDDFGLGPSQSFRLATYPRRLSTFRSLAPNRRAYYTDVTSQGKKNTAAVTWRGRRSRCALDCAVLYTTAIRGTDKLHALFAAGHAFFRSRILKISSDYPFKAYSQCNQFSTET